MKHKIQNLHESVRVYRAPHKQGKSEALEQIDCYQWFKYAHPDLLLALFHVPNEQKASVQYQSKLNQMGRLKGVADMILLHPINGMPYALFELKRRDGGSLSKEQKAFLNHHAEKGAFICVCYGFEQFKLAVSEYLS